VVVVGDLGRGARAERGLADEARIGRVGDVEQLEQGAVGLVRALVDALPDPEQQPVPERLEVLLRTVNVR